MLKHDEEKKTVTNTRMQEELIAFVLLPNEMEYTLRLLFPSKYAFLYIFPEAFFSICSH